MVVNVDHGTIDSPLHPDQVDVPDDVPEAIKILTDLGYGLAVATNQPAAKQNKTTHENLLAVHEKVLRLAQSHGGKILSSHICFHRAEENCICRKPKTKLLEDAIAANKDYSAAGGWMIGDGVTDVMAGALLGLNTGFVGKEKIEFHKVFEEYGVFPTHWGKKLLNFANYIRLRMATHKTGDHKVSTVQAPSIFKNKIKIYSDGADMASLLEMANNPNVHGITTNPTLMKKAGIAKYKEFCIEVLSKVKDKPISFEIFADDLVSMKSQALEISSWGKNVYVKIPVTNTEGVSTAPLVKELSHLGVRLNVTAILTIGQVYTVCEALKGGAPAVVSVFAGRVADTGRDPMPVMAAASELCRAAGENIELLWASTREVFNVIQAEQAGCDIITVAPDMIKKMSMLNMDLLQLSIETVRMFKRDADQAGFQL